MTQRRTKVLFVDDDEQLLATVRELMEALAGNAWEIHAAQDTARGLALLREQKIDLLVLDVHMPVVDGLQFLKLLHRKFPNLLKVVLTGDATGAYRAACLNSGAELFLEKPRAAEGWQSVFATLHEITRFQPEEEQGFRGVLRRVGLQDVIQMECLARNSAVLEVETGETLGKIYILDGRIIHTQAGERTGEEAFYQLLGLGSGEFNLKSFIEPPSRTIEGSWEFLLMEAARKRDEVNEELSRLPSASQQLPEEDLLDAALAGESALPSRRASSPPGQADPEKKIEAKASTQGASRPQIDEMLVCSSRGEVLYEWQCHNTNARINFLEFLSQKARQLGQGLPVGQFDRIEIEGENGRVVSQLQGDHSIFLRSSQVPIKEGEQAV